MKKSYWSSLGLVVALLALIALLAWVGPGSDAEAGSCEGGVRQPITWTITNNEVGNLGSPGRPVNVEVSPDFPTSDFSPLPIPNRVSSGDAPASATAQTEVPPDFAGTVTLTYDFRWSGTSGEDTHYNKSISETVEVCEQPTTTTTEPPTTTTTEPTTTVTEPPTTVTTVPSTTAPTTTTTEPTTTTTEVTTTTEPPTTVTTEPPATTTEPPTTEPPSSEPPTTERPTTTEEPPGAPVPGVPAARPQPVTPSFTG